jgi:hypothetical protein
MRPGHLTPEGLDPTSFSLPVEARRPPFKLGVACDGLTHPGLPLRFSVSQLRNDVGSVATCSRGASRKG